MIKVLLVTLLLVGLAAAGKVAFKPCSAPPTTPQAVINYMDIPGCADGATTCNFKKGATYNITVSATWTGAGGSSGTSPLPYEIKAVKLFFSYTTSGNVCGSGTPPFPCPVAQGQTVTYTLTATIPTNIPAMNGLTVEFRFWNSAAAGTNPSAAVCDSITANIQE